MKPRKIDIAIDIAKLHTDKMDEPVIGFRELLLKYAESVAFTCNDENSLKLFFGFTYSFVKSGLITKQQANDYLAEFGLDPNPSCTNCNTPTKNLKYLPIGRFCSYRCMDDYKAFNLQ
jgi:hypothetical protein